MVAKEQVIDVLSQCKDPEINIDIWTLGLVYEIRIEGEAQDKIYIKMTFTSPACPYGPMLVHEVKSKLEEIPGASEAVVDVVFVPPWEPSGDVRAILGV